jgi:hypothetical protein
MQACEAVECLYLPLLLLVCCAVGIILSSKAGSATAA